jgi:hypothetical protein
VAAASRTLIATADDFGRSLPVHDAVEEAHRPGIRRARFSDLREPAAA